MIFPSPLVAGIGPTELIIVLVIVLVVFGPKQLPKIGRAIGGGIKEFKDGLRMGSDDEERGDNQARSTTVTAHPPEALPPSPPGEAPAAGETERTRDQAHH